MAELTSRPENAMSQPVTGELEDPMAEEDDDWFGEGSSFDSGEDLAAALFAIAGAPVPTIFETVADTPVASPSILSVNTAGFQVIERGPEATDKTKWRIRDHSTTGRLRDERWGIRHSVQILKRTEQMLARLQRDAVEVTFGAASLACAQDLRQSSHREAHEQLNRAS